MADHGGARAYAGRKPGSKNKISRSAQAQAAFAALVLPRLEIYFQELDDMAVDRSLKPNERLASIRELLDRSMGRAVQSVIVESSSEPDDVSSDDLLKLWDSVDDCPPADNADD